MKRSDLTPRQRLARIAQIIETVDNRAMAAAMAADGPVTPTLQAMTQQEMSEIYRLASGHDEDRKLTPRKRRARNAL